MPERCLLTASNFGRRANERNLIVTNCLRTDRDESSMNWAIELSRIHKPSSGQANLYGVILYTNSHAYVAKVLSDPIYWSALDEISGQQWSVFATKVAQGRYKLPTPPANTMVLMIPVWKEPAANKELLHMFQLENTKSLPLLAIFAADEDGTIEQTVIPLSDSSLESAYESIQSILKTVADAIRQVEDGNLNDGTRAFRAVRYAIKGYNEKQVIKRAVDVWRWLRSL